MKKLKNHKIMKKLKNINKEIEILQIKKSKNHVWRNWEITNEALEKHKCQNCKTTIKELKNINKEIDSEKPQIKNSKNHKWENWKNHKYRNWNT